MRITVMFQLQTEPKLSLLPRKFDVIYFKKVTQLARIAGIECVRRRKYYKRISVSSNLKINELYFASYQILDIFYPEAPQAVSCAYF